MNQVVKQGDQNIVTLDEAKAHNSASIAIESSRAVQQVQASLVIAKKFPRNEIDCANKLYQACRRPGLAEVATYSYPRGGQKITGASIRLAEAAAQYWGNIEFGWRELERKPGESTLQAYCWDKESNTQREQTFAVKHIRDTKGGGKALTDEREIYENNANMAARRMRACILAMIPGDIIEAAVAQAELTITTETKSKVTPENKKRLYDGFLSLGITRKMIEARILRDLDSIPAIEFVGLIKIANSLKDGMSEPKDWFNMELAEDVKGDGKKKPAAGTAKPKETPEAENKDQLENFKAKNKKPEPHKPAQVSKPYTPAGAAKPTHDENGEMIDNGDGDPEPE